MARSTHPRPLDKLWEVGIGIGLATVVAKLGAVWGLASTSPVECAFAVLGLLLTMARLYLGDSELFARARLRGPTPLLFIIDGLQLMQAGCMTLLACNIDNADRFVHYWLLLMDLNILWLVLRCSALLGEARLDPTTQQDVLRPMLLWCANNVLAVAAIATALAITHESPSSAAFTVPFSLGTILFNCIVDFGVTREFYVPDESISSG